MTEQQIKRLEKKLRKLASKKQGELEKVIGAKYKYFKLTQNSDTMIVALIKAIDKDEFKLTDDVFDLEGMKKNIKNDEYLDHDNIFSNAFRKKLDIYEQEVIDEEDKYEEEIGDLAEEIDEIVENFIDDLTAGSDSEKVNFAELVEKFKIALEQVVVV